jgi:hypothetical protein
VGQAGHAQQASEYFIKEARESLKCILRALEPDMKRDEAERDQAGGKYHSDAREVAGSGANTHIRGSPPPPHSGR